MSKVMRARAWVFTHNTAVFADGSFLRPELWPSCKLCVYQLEVGETTGLHHLQGYVEFVNARTLSSVKALPGMGDAVHLEVRRGTGLEALAYCMKDDTRVAGPWFYPSHEECLALCAQQGKRNDLLVIKRKIDDGVSNRDLWQDEETFEPMMKFHKAFAVYKMVSTVSRGWQPVIVSIIGPTDCGKTRWCHENFPGLFVQSPGDWWDGYDGHETVLIDEMHGGRFKFSTLLQLLDRYPMNVPVKVSVVGCGHIAERVG